MPFNAILIPLTTSFSLSRINSFITLRGDICDFIILGLVISLIAIIVLFIATYQKMNLTIKRISTEKRKNENKRFESISEAANFLALDSIPFPLAIYDKTGNLQFVNSKARLLTNLPKDFSLNFNLFDSNIISDIDKDIIFSGGDISGTINSNDIISDSPQIFGASLKKNLFFNYTIHPTCDTDGKIRYIIFTSDNNIIHQTKSEESDEQLALISESLRHTGVTLYMYNVKEDVYYRFNGFVMERVETLTQESTFKAIEPQKRAQYIEMFLKIKSGELINDRRQYRLFIKSSGKYIHVDTYTSGITDKDGYVSRIFQSIQNINDSVKKSEKLENYKRIISKALPIIHLTAWTFDCSTKTFHSTNEDIVGTASYDDIYNAIHPEDQNKFTSTYKKLIDGKNNSIYAVLRIFDKQFNTYRFCEVYCISQKDASDSITSIIGVIHDISDKFAVERKLEDFSEKAIKFTTLSNTWIFSYFCKSNIFTSVSHHGYRRQDDPLFYIDFVHIEYRQVLVDLYEQVKSQSIIETKKIIKVNYCGEVKNCIFSFQAYEYENEKPTKYIGYAHVY